MVNGTAARAKLHQVLAKTHAVILGDMHFHFWDAAYKYSSVEIRCAYSIANHGSLCSPKLSCSYICAVDYKRFQMGKYKKASQEVIFFFDIIIKSPWVAVNDCMFARHNGNSARSKANFFAHQSSPLHLNDRLSDETWIFMPIFYQDCNTNAQMCYWKYNLVSNIHINCEYCVVIKIGVPPKKPEVEPAWFTFLFHGNAAQKCEISKG